MNSNGFVNLGDPSVTLDQSGGGEKKKVVTFKGEGGHSYRIYFPTQEVCERRRHWSPGVAKPDGTYQNRGYYRCTQDTHGYCPVCVKAATDKSMKRSSQTFGANIVVYETDQQGNVTEPVNAHIAFWAFGAPKFENLRQLIKEWGPLTDYDLLITCTDTQFQKMMIQPAKKCLAKEIPQLGQQIQRMLETDSVPLDKFLCRDVTPVELAGVFGIPVSELPPQFVNTGTAEAPAYNTPAAPAPQAVPNDVPFDTGQQAQTVPTQTQAQIVQNPQTQTGSNPNYTALDELTALL